MSQLRWRKSARCWYLAPPGARLQIEWRPKLCAFDLLDMDGVRIGWRQVPKKLGRSDDLFALIGEMYRRLGC